jgi:Rod binding domain-containing protein
MLSNGVSSPAPLTLSPQLATPAAVSARGAQAAREFEAQLVGSLLESMEKTFAALPGDDSVPGADNYNFLATHALAQAIAERGGFGIAAMIARHLPLEPGTAGGASRAGATVSAATTEKAAPK